MGERNGLPNYPRDAGNRSSETIIFAELTIARRFLFMKIALFSDIHANLPALEATLNDIDVRSPDFLFCLGDLVGYAPWPDEVVARIRERRIATIAGNYDLGVGRNSDDCGCAYKTDEDRRRGDESIAYTNRVVSGETRDFLRRLPRHIRIETGVEAKGRSVLMVHGSPRRVNEYLFEDRPDASFVRMMDAASADVMVFGHTHKPFHRVLSADGRERHAVNIGSVGKPKDGDPRACYVLLEIDDDRLDVEFVRVTYDVERAARAVEASELPDAFADMLRKAY